MKSQHLEPEKFIEYCYPTQRIGKICNIFEQLEYGQLEKVVEEIKSDPKMYEHLFKTSLDTSLEGREQHTVMGDFMIEQYEGTAVHSPSYKCIVMDKDGSFEFTSAATIIVCMKPNRSKVWCHSSLTKIGDNPATKINKNQFSNYFEKISRVNEMYADKLCSYFKDSISNVRPDITCNWLHTMDIRAVSSLDNSIQKIVSPIKNETPFSVIEFLSDEESKPVIKDQVYFVLTKSINSVEDYKSLFRSVKKKWAKGRQSKIVLDDSFYYEDSILKKGYQWFGYSFQENHAIFLRREDLYNNKSCFFGIVTDSIEKIKINAEEDNPNSSSISIAEVVAREFTRHI
ncbi:MAG: hypothetical protein L6266_01205 [Nanoarchaeota archaeon]|nr:hypothetical protein [Nanoarchaeota archaeon]